MHNPYIPLKLDTLGMYELIFGNGPKLTPDIDGNDPNSEWYNKREESREKLTKMFSKIPNQPYGYSYASRDMQKALQLGTYLIPLLFLYTYYGFGQASDTLGPVWWYKFDSDSRQNITADKCIRALNDFKKGLKARILPNIINYGSNPFPLMLNIPDPTHMTAGRNDGADVPDVFTAPLNEDRNCYCIWPVLIGYNHNAEKEAQGWDFNTKGDYADFICGAMDPYGSVRTTAGGNLFGFQGCSMYFSSGSGLGNRSYSGSNYEMLNNYFYDKLLSYYVRDSIVTARKYYSNPSGQLLYGNYKCWCASGREYGQTVSSTNGFGVPEQEYEYTKRYPFFLERSSTNYATYQYRDGYYKTVNGKRQWVQNSYYSTGYYNYISMHSFRYNSWASVYTRTAIPNQNYSNESDTQFMIIGCDQYGRFLSQSSTATGSIQPCFRIAG